MEASPAHQLLPVRPRPQQGIEGYHWSIVAAAPSPSRQAEALIGQVPLCRPIGGGPGDGPRPSETPLAQVPENRKCFTNCFSYCHDKEVSASGLGGVNQLCYAYISCYIKLTYQAIFCFSFSEGLFTAYLPRFSFNLSVFPCSVLKVALNKNII